MEKNYNLNGLSILIILTFVVLLGVAVVESNLSVLITSFLYITVGTFFTIYLSKKQYKNAIYLFYLFYLFYLLHMSFIHYGLLFFYDRSNLAPDELWFYASSNQIIPYLKAGYTLFDVAAIFEYHELSAYIYLTGWLAILANEVGNNSVFIQKLLDVFLASLIPVVLYLILKMYVKEKIAVYSAIVYGAVTYITPFSTMILRDIPVALTYIIFLWAILQKISVKNLLLLSFVSFISFFLRFETGIFLIGMTSVYLVYAFEYFIKNKPIKRLLIAATVVLGMFIVIESGLDKVFIDIFTGYGKSALVEAQSGSLGLKLAALPYGLNIIGMTIFSQLQPFPIWMVFEDFGILMLFSMFSGLTWFFVWGYTIYGITKGKIFQLIDVKLKFLFYFALVYIGLLASTGTITRRLMAVYPIIFLLAVLTFVNISQAKRVKVFLVVTLAYLLMMVAYLVLKL